MPFPFSTSPQAQARFDVVLQSLSFYLTVRDAKLLRRKKSEDYTDIGPDCFSSKCVCVHTVPLGVLKFQISESVPAIG